MEKNLEEPHDTGLFQVNPSIFPVPKCFVCLGGARYNFDPELNMLTFIHCAKVKEETAWLSGLSAGLESRGHGFKSRSDHLAGVVFR